VVAEAVEAADRQLQAVLQEVAIRQVGVVFGRFVALCCYPSALHQVHEEHRWLFF
jgi:hypothetical protein